MSVTATHVNSSGPAVTATAAATNCFNMKHLQNLVKDEVMNYYNDFQQAPALASSKKNGMLPPGGPSVGNGISFARKASAAFNTIDLEKNEKRVLVIYSGGTIGMSRGPNGSLVCIPHMLEKTVRRFPHMHDEEYAKQRFGGDTANSPLCLP